MKFDELITSETMTEFYKALSTFQGKVEQPRKDKENKFFGANYVPLENVIESINKTAPELGLSYVQFAVGKNEEGEMGVVTRINHDSGEFMQFPALYAPITGDKYGKITAQSYGSVLTYARRYSLVAAFGLSSDIDDDGNSGSGRDTVEQQNGYDRQDGPPPQNGQNGGKNQRNGSKGTNTRGNSQNAAGGRTDTKNNTPKEKDRPAPITAAQKDAIDEQVKAISYNLMISENEVWKRLQNLYKKPGKAEIPLRNELTAKWADSLVGILTEHAEGKKDLPPVKEEEPTKGAGPIEQPTDETNQTK